MNEKYRIEIEEFQKRFIEYKSKKIVLYGIGRYTATLVEGLRDFQIVGLMDKDPGNIGKKIFGLPVMDIQSVEENADMVVINASETYWNTIYGRIEGIKIPVFFKNGRKAKKIERYKSGNLYKNVNKSSLFKSIEWAEIVSFDFYDTLFMRTLCNPGDIFHFLEQELGNSWLKEKTFAELRREAIKKLPENYSLDELYANIEMISKLPHSIIEKIKEKELCIEKRMIYPRVELLELFKEVLESGKEIYIISDMYLPKTFYIEICEQYKIDIEEKRILLSNVLHCSKADGSLWNYYAKIVEGRQALHIGDHELADKIEPQRYGIQACLIPSPWELMSVSSMRDITTHVYTDYDSAITGCILKKIFANPYKLNKYDGVVHIRNNNEMGYIVFGPVILTFLMWLDKQRREDKVSNLIFMSRDGYFLKEDYEYLCELTGERPDCCYIGISRQLVMSASITTKDELLEYALMPYSGGITELFEDRFKIKGVKELPGKTIENYLEDYDWEIRKKFAIIRNNYLHYLEEKNLNENSAVVDLGYYGNNQRYLNKLTNVKLSGYYFNTNLSKLNENARIQQMKACFQKKNDLTGEESQILKKMLFIESVLTAPYGMVEAIDGNGNFLCSEKKKNQLHFSDKEEINKGIKEFMKDYVELFGNYNLKINPKFIDWYYGYCMNGALEIEDKVKQSFYNDNAMMNRIESMLFY